MIGLGKSEYSGTGDKANFSLGGWEEWDLGEKGKSENEYWIIIKSIYYITQLTESLVMSSSVFHLSISTFSLPSLVVGKQNERWYACWIWPFLICLSHSKIVYVNLQLFSQIYVPGNRKNRDRSKTNKKIIFAIILPIMSVYFIQRSVSERKEKMVAIYFPGCADRISYLIGENPI